MAYLFAFEIHGLAGRKHPVKARLERDLNVIWGLNGAGKTTLLNIVNAAFEDSTRGLDQLPFEYALVDIYSEEFKGVVRREFTNKRPQNEVEESLRDVDEYHFAGASLEGELLESRGADTSPGWQSKFVAPNDFQGALDFSFQHQYLPVTRIEDARVEARVRSSRTGNEPIFSSDRLFVEQVRSRWLDYRSKSLAEIRDVQQQGLANVLAILFRGNRGTIAPSLIEVDAEEAYALVRDFLHEQNIRLGVPRATFIRDYKTSAQNQHVVAEIEDVRRAIAKIRRPQLEFQSVIDEMYSEGKQLELNNHSKRATPLRVKNAGKNLPLGALSSGEKQLLQLLLAALGAENSTLMVDEPELSLHVDWQRRIIDSFSRVNPSAQLILATHSPEILARAPERSIVEL